MEYLLKRVENRIEDCDNTGNLEANVEMTYKELLTVRRLLKNAVENEKRIKRDNQEIQDFFNKHY